MSRTGCMVAAAALLFAAACGESDTGDDGSGLEGKGGAGGSVVGAGGGGGEGGGDAEPTYRFVVVADESMGLNVPRDLDFHPETGHLWIINRADDSTTIVFTPTEADSPFEHRKDAAANHFQEEASSIAFGARNFMDEYSFGTCQETANTYDGQFEPNYFMGPTLWSAHLDVYAVSDPYGLGSHLDMLHESPYCMGIAHEVDNVYWVFDGHNSRIVRYDFVDDHGIGEDYHSDAIIRAVRDIHVKRVPDVPSHLILDKATGILYIADTGNQRVVQMDIESGVFNRDLSFSANDRSRLDDGTIEVATFELWDGYEWSELVPTDSKLLKHPSGIDLHDGKLWVSDNATGAIHAFDLEGNLLQTIETEAEERGLMGIKFGPDGNLYYTDAVGNQVVRIERQ